MDINILTSLEQIDQIKEAWRHLAEELCLRSIFSFPEWSIAWLKSYGISGRPYIICAWNKSEMVGVLPLFESRGKREDLFLRRLTPIGGGDADYHIPIIKKDKENIIFEKLMDAAPQSKKMLFLWPHLPENNPTLPMFRQYFVKKGWPWIETSSVSPFYMLRETYKLSEISWKNKIRTNVRRRKRKLENLGLLNLEILDNTEDIINYLQEFFHVYTDKWMSENKPSMFISSKNRNFFRNMVYYMPLHYLHISSLKLNNERISYIFGFFLDGWLLDYKPTYRKEYQKFSPGNVHMSMLMEYGCSKGWKGIDFGQGGEAYKWEWTSDFRNHVTLTAGIKGGGIAYRWAASFKPRYWKKIEPFYHYLKRLLPLF